MKVIGAFKSQDFLPNVVSEMLADGSISQRIQLRNTSGSLSITILSERVDIEWSAGRKEGFSEDEKKSLQSDLYQMLNMVYQVYDEVIPAANRVAWFVSYVMFEIDDDEKQEYIDRFLKKPKFYQSNSADDLLIRFSGRGENLIMIRPAISQGIFFIFPIGAPSSTTNLLPVKICASFVKIWCLPASRTLCYDKPMKRKTNAKQTQNVRGGKGL